MSDQELKQAYAKILADRAHGDRSACASPDELLALVVGRLSGAVRLELLDHVMGCGDCLPEFELLRAIHEGHP